MQTATTPNRAARRLNAHCERYNAGFYAREGVLSGRFFGARVKAGALEVFDGEAWQTADLASQTFADHVGRTVFL